MPRCLVRTLSTWSAARRSVKQEVGATAIEYAMMICMVALCILAFVAILGGVVSDWFNLAATAL